MKKALTLKKNNEFRRLYAKGNSAVSPYLVMYCRKNRYEHNRLGITVSTKIGKAVVRNRARRRLREIYRLNTPAMRQGYDIVLVARTRTVVGAYAEVDSAFLHLADKLGLLLEKKV